MPNYDVDVHFEYKKYVPKIASCEDRCPCDDEVDFIDPREGRDPNPRKLLVFREHIHDTEMEERVMKNLKNHYRKLPESFANMKLEDEKMGPFIRNKKTDSGYIWRDLILVRNNRYIFNFENNESIFHVYDKEGNELTEAEGVYTSTEWIYPLIIIPNDRTPDFIEYKMADELVVGHGNIMVKNINHVAGLVTAYNYLFGSKTEIKLEEGEVLVASRKNGVYYTGLTNYVDLNEIQISSVGGQEPKLQDSNELTYINVLGYLDTNLMTTIFAHLAKEVGDYRKTHMHLQRFFGIGRHPIDLIKLDYISMFMWTDNLNLHDLTKILYINLLCEYANKFGIYQNLLEIIVSRIVNSSQAFKYEDDYYIKDLLITAKLDARFAEVFSVTYIKVLNAIEEGKGLSYLYSTLKVIKSEIIQKENYSVHIPRKIQRKS